MYCKYCGAYNPDDAPYCAHCGYKTQQPAEPFENADGNPKQPAAAAGADGSSYLKWLIPLICTAGVIGVLLVIYALSNQSSIGGHQSAQSSRADTSASSAQTTTAGQQKTTTAASETTAATTVTETTQEAAAAVPVQSQATLPPAVTEQQTYTAAPPAPVTQVTTTAAPQKTWDAEYAAYLRNTSLPGYIQFMLMYIDGDDIPEMVINSSYMVGDHYYDTNVICTMYNGQFCANEITDGFGIFGFSSGKKNCFVFWDEYTDTNAEITYVYHLDSGRPVRNSVFYQGYNPISYQIDDRSVTEDEMDRAFAPYVEAMSWGIGLVGEPNRYYLGGYQATEEDIVRVLERHDYYNKNNFY